MLRILPNVAKAELNQVVKWGTLWLTDLDVSSVYSVLLMQVFIEH